MIAVIMALSSWVKLPDGQTSWVSSPPPPPPAVEGGALGLGKGFATGGVPGISPSKKLQAAAADGPGGFEVGDVGMWLKTMREWYCKDGPANLHAATKPCKIQAFLNAAKSAPNADAKARLIADWKAQTAAEAPEERLTSTTQLWEMFDAFCASTQPAASTDRQREICTSKLMQSARAKKQSPLPPPGGAAGAGPGSKGPPGQRGGGPPPGRGRGGPPPQRSGDGPPMGAGRGRGRGAAPPDAPGAPVQRIEVR